MSSVPCLLSPVSCGYRCLAGREQAGVVAVQLIYLYVVGILDSMEYGQPDDLMHGVAYRSTYIVLAVCLARSMPLRPGGPVLIRLGS